MSYLVFLGLLVGALGIVALLVQTFNYSQTLNELEKLKKKVQFNQEVAEYFEDCLIEQELINWAIMEDANVQEITR